MTVFSFMGHILQDLFGKTDRWLQNMFTNELDFRSSRPEVFFKGGVLRILQNSQKNNCDGVSFKLETPTKVFSCEFCKISLTAFFKEHLRWLLLDSLHIKQCVSSKYPFLYWTNIWTRWSLFQTLHLQVQNLEMKWKS